MNDTLLKRYVALTNKIDVLKEQQDQLKALIMADMDKQGLDSYKDTSIGSISISQRVTYTYSTAVQKLAEKLKIAQTKDVQKGTAKVKSTTRFMTFRAAKKNED